MLDYDKLATYSTLRRESLISEVERVQRMVKHNTWNDPLSKRLRNNLGELLISMGTRLKDTRQQPLELVHQQ
jgi:hypothetical protein